MANNPTHSTSIQRFNQLTLFNVLLFVFLLGVLEFFFMTAGQTLFVHFFDGTALGELVLAGFTALLVLEIALVFYLDGAKTPERFLTPLLLTHLPWVLGLAAPLAARVNLPEPHNFLLRKVEILLGFMWVTHLFAFSGWLLWRVRGNGKSIANTFGIMAVFFFVGVTLWTTCCDLSGDEPHYLLMAQTLVRHGNLDLTEGYQNKTYEEFYHRGVLEPQGLEHVIDGKRYSHHPLGPVLLILPGFYLLGRLGAALTMALLTALALYLSLRVLELTGAQARALRMVGTVGLFSCPFLLFAGLIFPEIPTACLMALVLYLVLQKRWLGLGLALGGFLWMHNRNVLLVIPILVGLAVEIGKHPEGRIQKAIRLAAGFAVPVLLLVWYFHAIYGVWTPLGAHNESFTSLFQWSRFGVGFLGLALDQECGLWFYFPIFATAVAGGLILWHSKNPLRHWVVGVFLFYYLFMSFYENLGLTPGTRYMVGVTPLLLFMLCSAFEKLRFNWWEVLTLISFLCGVLVNWVLAVVPWMRYNKLEGENMMLKILGNIVHLPLTAGEPAFQAAVIEPRSYYISLFWLVVTVILSVWFWKANKNNSRE
jgi:hypothetical protein